MRVLHGLQVVADVGVETHDDGSSSTWPAYVLGGLIYSPTDALDVDVGVKGGLTEPETDLVGLVGVTWRF